MATAIPTHSSGDVLPASDWNLLTQLNSQVALLNAGSAVVGTSPGATSAPTFYIQAGSNVVTTTSGGGWSFSYPTSFPNGVLANVAWLGDNGVPGFITGQQSGMTGGVLQGLAYTSASSVMNAATIRINWIAIGW